MCSGSSSLCVTNSLSDCLLCTSIFSAGLEGEKKGESNLKGAQRVGRQEHSSDGAGGGGRRSKGRGGVASRRHRVPQPASDKL